MTRCLRIKSSSSNVPTSGSIRQNWRSASSLAAERLDCRHVLIGTAPCVSTGSIDHAQELLEKPTSKGWMGRWLGVLKEEAAKGFHPELPKFGFGDPTSYQYVGDAVNVTRGCGAVRTFSYGGGGSHGRPGGSLRLRRMAISICRGMITPRLPHLNS